VLAARIDLIDSRVVVMLGMGAPFFVGLFGIVTLHRAFRDLLKVLPITHERRGKFLLRMVLCWGALFSVVAPVALCRLADVLSQVL
jgi:hypothetical protein